jgi:hypothetical protein
VGFVPALGDAFFAGAFVRLAPFRAPAFLAFVLLTFVLAFDAARAVLAREEVFFVIRYPVARVGWKVTAKEGIRGRRPRESGGRGGSLANAVRRAISH